MIKKRRKHYMYASLFVVKWFFIILMYYHLDTHMKHGAEKETQITAATMERFLQDNPDVIAEMLKEVLIKKQMLSIERLVNKDQSQNLSQQSQGKEAIISKNTHKEAKNNRVAKTDNLQIERKPDSVNVKTSQDEKEHNQKIVPSHNKQELSENKLKSDNAKAEPIHKDKAKKLPVKSEKGAELSNLNERDNQNKEGPAEAHSGVKKENMVETSNKGSEDTEKVSGSKKVDSPKNINDTSPMKKQESKQPWKEQAEVPKKDPVKISGSRKYKKSDKAASSFGLENPVAQSLGNPRPIIVGQKPTEKADEKKDKTKHSEESHKISEIAPIMKFPSLEDSNKILVKNDNKDNDANRQSNVQLPNERTRDREIGDPNGRRKLYDNSNENAVQEKQHGMNSVDKEKHDFAETSKIDTRKPETDSSILKKGHNLHENKEPPSILLEGKKQAVKEVAAKEKPKDVEVARRKESKGVQYDEHKRKDINLNSPGSLGKPVLLEGISIHEQRKTETRKKMYGFNVAVSDKIGVERTLPDYRDQSCMESGRYSKDLPGTTIVICFCNEPWSSLLRTIHSVLANTPENLIKEVLLIDDYSTVAHLKSKLTGYLAKFPKVRLVRSDRREGIVAARNKGARLATTSTLTFLDPHCEVSKGWLEPLLDVMVKKQNAVAIPVLESIDEEDFSIQGTPCTHVPVGSFDWTLQAVWSNQLTLAEDDVDPCGNFLSPTLVGGIFTIHTEYFEELGFFDGQIKTAREQDLDLSFKAWMCGHGIDVVPCSHVGHIYRIKGSQTTSFGSVEQLRKIKARLASVWLDEYAPYVNQKMGFAAKDAGDIEEMVLLKDSLQCKSFKWYMNNVQPDIYDITKAEWYGEVKNQNGKNMCIDSMGKQTEVTMGLEKCHGTMGNQYWSLTPEGQLRQDHVCIHVDSIESVMLKVCEEEQSNKQIWMFDSTEMKLHHPHTSYCLGISKFMKPTMYACDSKQHIYWKFQFQGRKIAAHEDYDTSL